MKARDFIARLHGVAETGGGWTAKCPAHPDESPSLSISEGTDGRILLCCFAGCDLRAIVAAVGMEVRDLFPDPRRGGGSHQPTVSVERPRYPLPKDLRKGSCTELSILAQARGLGLVAGLEVITQRGILWFSERLPDRDGTPTTSWILTDSARRNAQARRLDGQPWSVIGGKKARTLRGWEASWPIGLADVREHNRPSVLLVEGGPDLLSAATVAWTYASGGLDDIGFACMAGAANRIPSDALTTFAGRRVIIPFHDDVEGLKAAARWESQLNSSGADAISFSLKGLTKQDGTPAKDLNDAIGAPELRELVEALFLVPS